MSFGGVQAINPSDMAVVNEYRSPNKADRGRNVSYGGVADLFESTTTRNPDRKDPTYEGIENLFGPKFSPNNNRRKFSYGGVQDLFTASLQQEASNKGLEIG